ncbi:MAG: response regulator [Deltaproteobacteria bacterium]
MDSLTVLMAEDDADDRLLIEEAFSQLESPGDVRFVQDGEELMHYLRREGKYADPGVSPRPALILLDLNMPRKDGREALLEMKADPDLQEIPVVVWTTSNEPWDKIQSRKAGASTYLTKPASYDDLLSAVRNIVKRYLAG